MGTRALSVILTGFLFFLITRVGYIYGANDGYIWVSKPLKDSVYTIVATYKDLIDADVVENFQKTEVDFLLQGPQPFPPDLFEEKWNSALSEKKRLVLGKKQKDSVYIMAYGADVKPALRYNFVLKRWEYSDDGMTFFPFSTEGGSFWIRQGNNLLPKYSGSNVILRQGEKLSVGTAFPRFSLDIQGDAFFRDLVTFNNGLELGRQIVKSLTGDGLRIENETLSIDTESNLFFTGYWSFADGRFQLPRGDSLPENCEVGDVFINTSAESNKQLYICTSKDIWTAQGAKGEGVDTFLALVDTVSFYTPGRILFETDSQVSDSPALYWDYQNNKLGINEGDPVYDLSVGGSLGIKEGGDNPEYYTVFKGSDQNSNIVYTLPASIGSGGYLKTDSLGNLVWDDSLSGATSSAVLWNEILNPVDDQSLNMSNYKTSFVWGSNTGSGNLFELTDSASNTGTGYLVDISSASGSSLNPLRVNVQNAVSFVVSSLKRVGVNNDSPQTDLHVSGGFKAERSLFPSSGYNGEEFFIDAYNKKYRYIDNISLPEELWDVFNVLKFGSVSSYNVQLFTWSDYSSSILSLEALDHSTFGRNGTYNNVIILPPSVETGISVWVYSFSGKDTYIKLPTISRFDTTKGLTIIALVQSLSTSESQGIFYTGVDQKNDFISLSIDGGNVMFSTSVGSSAQKLSAGKIVSKNWFAVAGGVSPGSEGSSTESYLLVVDRESFSGIVSEDLRKGSLLIPRSLDRPESYIGRSFSPVNGYLNGRLALVVFAGNYIDQDNVRKVLFSLINKFVFITK